MFRLHLLVFVSFLVVDLVACSRASTTARPPPPPSVAMAVKPAPPPKMATMICKNSETGSSVRCGTPNAVMVGMKEN